MRTLVTGHKGYLGYHVVADLLAAGHGVRGIDADWFRACDFPNYPSDQAVRAIPAITKDIRVLEERDLEGFDAVIHLAGLSNDLLGDLDPELTFEINHKASVRLARQAKSAGVSRMVLASSCSVYGAGGEDMIDENALLRPQTAYARSKLDMETDIASLAGAGFCPVFLRGGTIYGLSPRIRFDLVVNNLTAWATATGRVLLKSDGRAWRPLTHVRDMASAFAAMLEQPLGKIRGQAYNVAITSQNFRIVEIARLIAAHLPECRIEFQRAGNRDTRNYRVSGEKLTRQLGAGWHRFDLEAGVVELLGELARTKIAPDDFEGPRFQRLAHLQKLMEQGKLDRKLFPA